MRLHILLSKANTPENNQTLFAILCRDYKQLEYEILLGVGKGANVIIEQAH